MCHQTVSLIARVLEEGGIPTVTFSNARDITTSAGNPRLVFLNYPLGNPVGRPGDPQNQREVLRAGLELLQSATEPTIVDLPYVWAEHTDWMRKFMTEEQPFLSAKAEEERQRLLDEARAQKSAPS